MSNIENAVALLRSMNPESLDAENLINSLSAPELHALESIDDLESLVGAHAPAVKAAAAKHPAAPKYKRHANVSLLITRTLTTGASTLVNGSNQSVALPAPCFGVLEDASDYGKICAVLSRKIAIHITHFAVVFQTNIVFAKCSPIGAVFPIHHNFNRAFGRFHFI